MLLPQGLIANHGFSYYGDHALTRIPYSLALTSSGVLLLLSSRCLPNDMPFRMMKIAFRLMALLLFGIVISTLPLAPGIVRIHVSLGVTLFVFQLIIGCWLTFFVCRDWRSQALLMVQFTGNLCSLLSLLWFLRLLLEGQLLVQLAFGLLVLHVMVRLRPDG